VILKKLPNKAKSNLTRVRQQIKDSTSTWQLFKYDGKSTLKSVGHAFTRPLYWKGDDYLKLGGLVAGSFLISSADQDVNRFVARQRADFPKVIRDFGWYYGSPQNYFAASAGIYGFGLLTKNEKVRKTGVLIIASSITTGALQSVLKNAVGRARPNTGLGANEFDFFSGKPDFSSFPSGHTILSVTMSHAIAKQFDNTLVKIGIYTIGAIPPISRLIDNAHWLSDIAFSTAVSIIVVDSIDKFLFNEKRYSYSKKQPKISWNFTFSSNKVGFTGTF